MRVAHFGTFDVQNYGDLLFPQVLEQALGDGYDVVHVSPSSADRPYLDSPKTISSHDLFKSGAKFDGVVVGGGNILHSRATNLAEYRAVRGTAYPGLWVTAAQVAARSNAPLIINAPGAPAPFDGLARPLLRQVARQTSYFAVRDQRSADHVTAASGIDVAVVPDTAIRLADIFGPADALIDGVPAAVRELLEGPGFLSLHVNDRYVDGGAPALAIFLDRISQALRRPMCLIAIGECHGDGAFAREVANQMTTEAVAWSKPSSVRSIAGVIAKSDAYIGSSMHGFITAVSYERPAFLVADSGAQHKFTGLVAHVNAEKHLFSSWDELTTATEQPSPATDLFSLVADAESAKLRSARHWEDVKSALRGQAGPAPRVLRTSIEIASSFSAQDRVKTMARRAKAIVSKDRGLHLSKTM